MGERHPHDSRCSDAPATSLGRDFRFTFSFDFYSKSNNIIRCNLELVPIHANDEKSLKTLKSLPILKKLCTAKHQRF